MAKVVNLLKPIKVGDLQLKNRVFMAPLTRCRADPATGIPNQLHIDYYSQRASAGLIISECSQISPISQAFPGSAGIHSEEQVQGWKKVNDAVHKKNGHIFLQIWHGGRAVHPANVGGKPGLAPSPIAIRTQVFTVQGIKPHMTPKEMTEEEIKQMIQDFRKGAENAMKAGFDGLELHGANGYIVDSFLRDHTNRRQDQWGGSVENRTRFCLEVVDQLVSVFGPNRVGVKVTPNGRYNDMFDSNPLKTYTYLAQQLSKKNIAYLHCAENDEDYISWVPNNFISGKKQMVSVAKDLRPHFKNTLVDNLGYGIVSADEAIQEGIADAISFGRAFMSNPDFVERIQNGWPLTEVDLSTSYLGGAKGYSDYPTYQQSLQQQQTKSHQY